MTVIMGCAFFYFLVAQNRWSWHLIGGRGQNEMEVRRGSLPPPLLPPACPITHTPASAPCTLLLYLQEVLPQHPPSGLPWDWHRRPLGGPPAAFNRQSSLDKRSSELPLHQRSNSELAGGGGGGGGGGIGGGGGVGIVSGGAGAPPP